MDDTAKSSAHFQNITNIPADQDLFSLYKKNIKLKCEASWKEMSEKYVAKRLKSNAKVIVKKVFNTSTLWKLISIIIVISSEAMLIYIIRISIVTFC